jgi:hypothetical protein
MKLFTLILASALVAQPAHAIREIKPTGAISPIKYVAAFCHLRASGVGFTESVFRATEFAFEDSRTPTFVIIDGEEVVLEALEGARYVMEACPELALPDEPMDFINPNTSLATR